MAKKGMALLDSVTGKVDTTETLVSCNTAHATFKSPSGSNASPYHAFGYMISPVAAKAATQLATTQEYGTANVARQAHVFVVCSGAGTATGGAGAVTLTVTGTTLGVDGTRATGQTETLIADITAATANKFVMSTAKFIGAVTFTLAVGATGHTAYALTFNYGFVSAFEFWGKKVTIQNFQVTGRAGATDTAYDCELLFIKNGATDWTYSADAFSPGPTALKKWSTLFSTERNIQSGERFGVQCDGLTQAVDGSAHEGVIVRITTGQNNAVESSDYRIRYRIDA